MRKTPRENSSLLSRSDKDSAKTIMQNMGLSKKEFEEISQLYGVAPSKLLEVMQLSKYSFIESFKLVNYCEPCRLPIYRGVSYS
jgi:hypothetical protein